MHALLHHLQSCWHQGPCQPARQQIDTKALPRPACLLNCPAAAAAAVQAELVLLTAALQDPLNVKFLLVSDSSLPLYPPQMLWAQLMAESTSRLDACTTRPDKIDLYRWGAGWGGQRQR